MRKGDRRALGYRLALLVLALLGVSVLVQISRADGGVVMCQRTSVPVNITLFSTEIPLRLGPVDLSILVERTLGHSAVLDAQVYIELHHEAGTTILAEATRSQARNKLLYCS